MTIFRPCIDLHSGQVKQIVGGTLSTEHAQNLKTNYVSKFPASYYAKLYKDSDAFGAHVIMLGPGNEEAAKDALSAWPGYLQVGGGINEKNAAEWIRHGASHVIVTSYLFPDGAFSLESLKAVLNALSGDTSKLVIDLSCRRKDGTWFVAMNKWQTITKMEITQENIRMLEEHCAEFLVHAADNEGLQRGIDEELIRKLSQWCSIPITYAGGAKHLADLERVRELSGGKVDVTIGSALDIFGGSAVKFDECMAWNRQQQEQVLP